MVYIENPKQSTKKKKKIPSTNRSGQQGGRAWDKQKTQKFIFLNISNEHMKTGIKNAIKFMITHKNWNARIII